MQEVIPFNLDEETIHKVGLKLSDKSINASITSEARVFSYPFLENVYIMENDLYGNIMPPNTCFLAFYGNHGLIGKHLKVETLKNSSVEEIKKMDKSDLSRAEKKELRKELRELKSQARAMGGGVYLSVGAIIIIILLLILIL